MTRPRTTKQIEASRRNGAKNLTRPEKSGRPRSFAFLRGMRDAKSELKEFGECDPLQMMRVYIYRFKHEKFAKYLDCPMVPMEDEAAWLEWRKQYRAAKLAYVRGARVEIEKWTANHEEA